MTVVFGGITLGTERMSAFRRMLSCLGQLKVSCPVGGAICVCTFRTSDRMTKDNIYARGPLVVPHAKGNLTNGSHLATNCYGQTVCHDCCFIFVGGA